MKMSDAIGGLNKLFNRLLRLKQKATNLHPALQAVGVYMLGSIERNFRAQGRPQKWQALAKSTLARRRKGKGKGKAQILVDKSHLKNSVTARNALVVTSDKAQIGTNLIYAKRQHYGYEGKEGRGHSKTPARPFLMFQTEDVKAIEGIFNRHLKTK